MVVQSPTAVIWDIIWLEVQAKPVLQVEVGAVLLLNAKVNKQINNYKLSELIESINSYSFRLCDIKIN